MDIAERAVRWVAQIRRARRGPALGAVLLYHRIDRALHDPLLLSVTPQHFREHLKVLAELGEVVPLDQLIKRRPRSRRFAITFDDGYRDNLSNAAPILAEESAPATVFVVPSVATSLSQRFWWDELERLCLRSRELPDRLSIRVKGFEWLWAAEESRPVRDPDRSSAWNVLDRPVTQTETIYVALLGLLRVLPPAVQSEALRQLSEQVDDDQPDGSGCRSMNPEEIAALDGYDVCTVGSHTNSHPQLSAHPRAFQAMEILSGKRRLEEMVGHRVEQFAYPYGERGTYSRHTAALVRDAGFSLACANIAMPVTPSVDRFAVPRLVVRDWDSQTFRAQVISLLET